jgi:hypothetical protein
LSGIPHLFQTDRSLEVLAQQQQGLNAKARLLGSFRFVPEPSRDPTRGDRAEIQGDDRDEVIRRTE